LAAAVVVSHAWALGGYGEEPALGGANLGRWAVTGFFGLSGFLIVRSRLRSPAPAFYRSRLLRIGPGFVVALLVTAFVVAPVIAALGGGAYSGSDATSYVLRNFALYPHHLYQDTIGTLLADRAHPALNGALWTLFWEAGCYVLTGVAVSVLPRHRLGAAAPTGFVAVSAASSALHLMGQPGPALLGRPLQMLGAFAAGACLLLWAERVPAGARSVALAGAALTGVVALGMAAPLAALPFTYLLLVASTALPLHRVGSRRDLSYGLYVYGWPVQQLLAVAGLPGQVGPLLFAAASLASALPLAWCSYAAVEAPAMRWGRRRPSTAPSAPSPTTAQITDITERRLSPSER
jgi:peptidoglycan/LPS O-acetylase OafA/YrhL